MTVTELLTRFADPEVINSLSTSDKLLAGAATTILGMGITFTALVVLLFIISWTNRILNPKKETAPSPVMVQTSAAKVPEISAQKEDQQIVAAITTALAMSLDTTVSNIVIKNITRVESDVPAWNRAGIIEQMNNRL